MRTVTEIYTEYKIMPSLQLHMLRVAAAASLICDNYLTPLPKEDIITACLFHDMGNMIKFNSKFFPEFAEPEGFNYWENVKNEFIRKYGANEHMATEVIVKDIDISDQAFDFLQHIGFSNAKRNDEGQVFEYKICNYADMRVGPYGVLPLPERIEEAHKRYATRVHSVVSGDFEMFSQSLRNMEKQIFTRCKIKPEDITDSAIEPIISKLRNFVIV